MSTLTDLLAMWVVSWLPQDVNLRIVSRRMRRYTRVL